MKEKAPFILWTGVKKTFGSVKKEIGEEGLNLKPKVNYIK
jgi:hypothetical protein